MYLYIRLRSSLSLFSVIFIPVFAFESQKATGFCTVFGQTNAYSASKFSMMIGITEWVSKFLKSTDEGVEIDKSDGKDLPQDTKRSNQIWPRLLSFSPSPPECEDEMNSNQTERAHHENQSGNDNNNNQKQQMPMDECDEDEEDDDEDLMVECDEEGNEILPRRSSGFMRKFRCMGRGARYGLREGALSGVFFGGSCGIYKYAKARKEETAGGGGQSDGESTVNDNIIFVTAANGAIAMAVFCMFFCCSKAALYCS